MRYISILLSCVLFSACEKKLDTQTKVLGHAASGLKMPNAIYHDNSLEAINYSLSLSGCQGVEVDVRMDANGKLWLYHDEFLQNETNASGCIEASSTQDLNEVQYQSFHKESLLQLSNQVIEKWTGNIFLDIKSWNACNETIIDPAAFRSSLLALGLDTSKVYLLVNSKMYFDALKNDFQVFLSLPTFDALSTISLENEPRLRGVCFRNKEISREQINFLKSIHKEIIVYEVRAVHSIKQALLKEPTYLFSDDLKATLGLIN